MILLDILNHILVNDFWKRVVIAAFFPISFVTYVLNVMMGASGTPRAYRMATTGMISSFLLGLGSIVGVWYISFRFLLPGLICQVLAFVMI
jgi:hypothetical protein